VPVKIRPALGSHITKGTHPFRIHSHYFCSPFFLSHPLTRLLRPVHSFIHNTFYPTLRARLSSKPILQFSTLLTLVLSSLSSIATAAPYNSYHNEPPGPQAHLAGPMQELVSSKVPISTMIPVLTTIPTSAATACPTTGDERTKKCQEVCETCRIRHPE
jgi:hypothetical protein